MMFRSREIYCVYGKENSILEKCQFSVFYTVRKMKASSRLSGGRLGTISEVILDSPKNKLMRKCARSPL
jgi:hypothetical protein